MWNRKAKSQRLRWKAGFLTSRLPRSDNCHCRPLREKGGMFRSERLIFQYKKKFTGSEEWGVGNTVIDSVVVVHVVVVVVVVVVQVETVVVKGKMDVVVVELISVDSTYGGGCSSVGWITVFGNTVVILLLSVTSLSPVRTKNIVNPRRSTIALLMFQNYFE